MYDSRFSTFLWLTERYAKLVQKYEALGYMYMYLTVTCINQPSYVHGQDILGKLFSCSNNIIIELKVIP